MSDLMRSACQSLERADAVIERISDDGETLRIWFRFVHDPVTATNAIDELRTKLDQADTRRDVISYLRLI
jgi:hypothetical protein